MTGQIVDGTVYVSVDRPEGEGEPLPFLVPEELYP